MEKKRSEESKIKGAEFERLARAAGIKWADLARELGVNPQTITHWRKRGVAAAHSVRVSQLLGCEPTDISWIAESLANATVESLRKANLNLLAVERSEEDLLESLSPGAFSAFMRGLEDNKNLSYQRAREIEKLLKLPPSWLDKPHTAEPAPTYSQHESANQPAEQIPSEAQSLIKLIIKTARNGTLLPEHIKLVKQQIQMLTGAK
ncbi:helix-turn-helix transcriptional regulator [Microbulbifer salipaludis]|uniref:Helix-turn-helix transcriptional regulator n=1 Tax=Microbulbifer salipaludis TaxID=187980 RepID=A0ABS3E942_9GAMM|nr:helix-turn-helix transcriptional regulator [Microbulbifer salipaludis]MBN8431830.1 helix-turn-helix transcriptional regulator [Microbulbifer salipaludis]